MISLSEQLRTWRSRYRLTKQEAATALGVTLSVIEALERGLQPLRGQARDGLLNKLSRPPGNGIKGPLPDAGYRPID